MGKQKTTQKSTQNTNQTSTTTPNVPWWAVDATRAQQNRINQLGQMDPSQFVAGSSPLQDLAFAGGEALANRMGIQGGGQTSSAPGFADGGAPVTMSGGGGGPSRSAVEPYGGGIVGMGGPDGSPGFADGGNSPNDFFQQAGLLANSVGNAGANTADRNTLGDAAQSQTGVLGDAAGYDPSLIGDIGQMDAAQIGANDISRLMNPYQQQVIDASLNQYDASREREAARMAANAAGRGAFSDGRYGIAEGEFNAGTARDRASLEAGLLSQGFNTALSAAENDVARRQQAGAMNFDANLQRLLANQSASNTAGQYNASADNAFALNRYGTETQNNQFNAANQNTFARDQFAADNQRNMFNAGQEDNALARALQSAGLLGNLGATMGAEERANLGVLSGLGEQQRGVDQDQRNAIPTWLQLISQLNAGQNYPLFTGQTSNAQGTTTGTNTTTQSGPAQWLNTMGAIGQGAQAGAILFSDERLKENIETAGYDAQGRRWVDYNYKGDPTRHRGVIAQEIQRSDPDAVIPDASGFLKVDYSKLGGVNV